MDCGTALKAAESKRKNCLKQRRDNNGAVPNFWELDSRITIEHVTEYDVELRV
jgi:hypothetical protein